jgi:hypothetical protein
MTDYLQKHAVPTLRPIMSKAVEMLQRLDCVRGVGMAGSHALGAADAYSDLDLQAYTADGFPEAQQRRDVYVQTRGVEVGQLGHVASAEFEKPPYSRGFVVDWVRIDGLKCDLLWIAAPALASVLAKVQAEPDHPETAAVLAQVVVPLFDPHDFIRHLKNNCPPYTEERARNKAGGCFGWARWFLCQWGVLAKAARRADVVAYQKAETQMVSNLIAALYAVNRVWMLDERRLRLLTPSFAILPSDFVQRLESLLMRQGASQTLEGSHRMLLELYRDLAVSAAARYPHWQLPTDWPQWSGQDGVSTVGRPI